MKDHVTLDPESWNEARLIAHQALDAVLDFQEGIRDRPVWQPVPQTTEALVQEPAPKKGLGMERVVQDMVQHIMPFPAGHAHPRFWGWVCGTGTPIGMVADMLAAGINASAGTFNEAPTRIENQVIRWMLELFDFPDGASGIITSGASMANVIGLAVARDSILNQDVTLKGLCSRTGPALVYASDQVHSSVDKGMQLLGLGRDQLRKIPTNDQFQIDLNEVEAAIVSDLERGFHPTAIVGNAGTVNTGAIDDLVNLSRLAKKYGIWFHVDGAIGGLAVMSEKLKPKFRGMELADSVAFDFHKWMYVPYEAGCVIVRDGDLHRKSFSAAASYLEAPPRGVAAMDNTTNVRGPQLSRGFKALKVWAQIREFGYEHISAVMEQNVAHVKRFSELVTQHSHLELLAKVGLNIACFRFVMPGVSESRLDQINLEILMALQEKGIAVPSSTRIGGKFALRIANTNHRTRMEDFELLIQETVQIGLAQS